MLRINLQLSRKFINTRVNKSHLMNRFMFTCPFCLIFSYLRDNFKIIDSTKICAYGWGYGGYLTSMLLTRDSDQTFLCYVAVSPIVSFQYFSEYLIMSVGLEYRWNIDFHSNTHRFVLYRKIFRLSSNVGTFTAGSRFVTASSQFSIKKLSSNSWHRWHARPSTAHDATDEIVDTEGCHLSASGETHMIRLDFIAHTSWMEFIIWFWFWPFLPLIFVSSPCTGVHRRRSSVEWCHLSRT